MSENNKFITVKVGEEFLGGDDMTELWVRDEDTTCPMCQEPTRHATCVMSWKGWLYGHGRDDLATEFSGAYAEDNLIECPSCGHMEEGTC